MTSIFDSYAPLIKSEQYGRTNGVLVSMAKGKTTAFSLYNIQARGKLFVSHGLKSMRAKLWEFTLDPMIW